MPPEPVPSKSRRDLSQNMRHPDCEACMFAMVRPRQLFEDKDMRPAGRVLKVVSVHPRVINSAAYARLRNVETGRESGVKLSRLIRGFWFLGYDDA